ncbi:MAG: AmmeMemoRadiSam system radical SAM enzyme [Candidatus Kariarchaeaceae archaeon]|jgi:pyruvate formate lyase activating enzyme
MSALKLPDNPQFWRPGRLFSVNKDIISCGTCNHRCNLRSNDWGKCNTRVHREGKLYTNVYGKISSISHNPMEKKPFFHFYPGTYATTVGTFSCNFTCPWCQNYTISKVNSSIKTDYISPEELVNYAQSNEHVQGICFSFNEPTLMLEYALDTIPIAKSVGLHTSYVTNGYMTKEALDLLIRSGLDAMTVTIKGSKAVQRKYTGSSNEFVWKNLAYAITKGIHLEIVYLMVTTVNDSRDIIQEMLDTYDHVLSRDTPLHLTRYQPDYEFHAPATPIKSLIKAHFMAKEMGLNYVYLGNVFDHPLENTYCPNCEGIVIKRTGYFIQNYLLEGNICENCGFTIPIRNSI